VISGSKNEFFKPVCVSIAEYVTLVGLGYKIDVMSSSHFVYNL